MIARYDYILEQFTDAWLRERATKGDGQREYAQALLRVPPEYRQGIETRVSDLSERIVNTPHGQMGQIMGSRDEARATAIQELEQQGIVLLTPEI